MSVARADVACPCPLLVRGSSGGQDGPALAGVPFLSFTRLVVSPAIGGHAVLHGQPEGLSREVAGSGLVL